MAAPFYLLLSKCNQAAVALLIAKGVGTAANVLAGKNAVLKNPPMIGVHAHNAEPEQQFTGRWRVQVAVSSMVNLNDDVGNVKAVDFSDQQAAAMTDALNFGSTGTSQPLCDLLNAQGVADFTVFAVHQRGLEAKVSDSGDVWIDTLHLEFVCCPFTIA